MSPIEIEGQIFKSYGYIIFPYYAGGDIIELINNAKNLNINLSMKFAEYLAKNIMLLGLIHHSLGFCHRDFKAENIVVDEEGNLALIDFQT